MNAHLLEPMSAIDRRGIGRLVARLRASAAPAWFTVSLLAAVILAVVPRATAAERVEPAATADPSQAPMVAVFSGDYANGLPVYRLPRMIVVARRQTDLARSDRQGLPGRAGEARPKVAAKPAA